MDTNEVGITASIFTLKVINDDDSMSRNMSPHICMIDNKISCVLTEKILEYSVFVVALRQYINHSKFATQYLHRVVLGLKSLCLLPSRLVVRQRGSALQYVEFM